MKIFASLAIAVVAVIFGSADAARTLTASIDIIAYNDVYELKQDAVNGFNIGGPSRVVPIARAMREKNPNSLVLFAGDTMSPSLWSTQFKGMQMTHAHKAIGVDFASLGNHEFDFGIEGFANVSSATNFPWLNANCYEIGTGTLLRGTRARAIKEFNDKTFGKIKIGLFGVMYDMKDSSKGLYWTDPIEAAKQQVAKLQTQGVDMIIALTHQDLADDNRLSKEVAGINLIYGGHDHASMLQTNFGTPYLKADFDFRSIWRSHVEYYAVEGSNPAVFRMTHEALPIREEMPSDKDLDNIISGYDKEIGQIFNRTVGTLCEDLNLQNKVVRAMDAPIGHIFADAQRFFYGEGSADVAITNGGGIRTDTIYKAGPLTLGQVVAWSPFGNTIMITETDGASLKKFITKENLASCGNGNVIALNGYYAHPAGVKYTFKCTASGVGSLTSLEWIDQATRSGPVKDDDVFKLALPNFLYTTEFSVIPGVRTKVLKSEAEAVRIDAALEWYVKQQKDAILCEKGPVRSVVSY